MLFRSGSETDFFSRWAGYQAKLTNAQQRLLKWSNLLSAVPALLASLNTAAILGVGALEVMEGRMTMGMLVAFQSLMNAFMNPVGRMVNLGSRFQEAMGDMNRLDDVLSYEQDPMYRQEVQKPSALANTVHLAGELTLEKITFGYNTLAQPLIKEFSLVLTPGSRVALVGASGSGKSTIAKLVCGLFQPWEGKILFDSLDKKKIPRQIMLNSLSYVDQDIFLIQGSVRENLTMWNTAVPDQIGRAHV